VYEADPRFENASAFYNLLARQNADTAEFSQLTTLDSSRLSQQSTLALRNNLSAAITVHWDITVKTVRMFQEFGGLTPWIYQHYDLGLALPISVYGIGVTLTPRARILAASGLTDESISIQSDALSPLAVAGSFSVEPVLGGAVRLSISPVTLTGDYRYGRIADSFRTGAERIVSHEASLDLRVGLEALPWEIFELSSAAIGGYYHLLSDTSRNTLYGGNENLSLVFHLSDAPWTNFTVTQSVRFQDSAFPGTAAYYAPDSVLQVSGGIGIGTWPSLGREAGAGVVANVGGGMTLSGIAGGNSELSTNVNADLRLELTIGDITYYLAAQGAGSFNPFPELDYWSFTGAVGARAELPRVLAD
jgi:hypothetical protein